MYRYVTAAYQLLLLPPGFTHPLSYVSISPPLSLLLYPPFTILTEQADARVSCRGPPALFPSSSQTYRNRNSTNPSTFGRYGNYCSRACHVARASTSIYINSMKAYNLLQCSTYDVAQFLLFPGRGGVTDGREGSVISFSPPTSR